MLYSHVRRHGVVLVGLALFQSLAILTKLETLVCPTVQMKQQALARKEPEGDCVAYLDLGGIKPVKAKKKRRGLFGCFVRSKSSSSEKRSARATGKRGKEAGTQPADAAKAQPAAEQARKPEGVQEMSAVSAEPPAAQTSPGAASSEDDSFFLSPPLPTSEQSNVGHSPASSDASSVAGSVPESSGPGVVVRHHSGRRPRMAPLLSSQLEPIPEPENELSASSVSPRAPPPSDRQQEPLQSSFQVRRLQQPQFLQGTKNRNASLHCCS